MQVFVERGIITKRRAGKDGKWVYLTVICGENDECDFTYSAADGVAETFSHVVPLQPVQIKASVQGKIFVGEDGRRRQSLEIVQAQIEPV